MKALFQHPFMIYAVAGVGALCIMIIIDYVLGPEAEHLNAWVIVNRWLGRPTGLADSLAVRKLGLIGATALMIVVNGMLGFVLINLLRGFIHLIHS